MGLLVIGLTATSLGALAQVDIQSVQYNPEKRVMYVKGKLTADPAPRVYVVDTERNRLIGTIDTYGRGQQFRADLPMNNTAEVPCIVKVQTSPPNPFWGSGGQGEVATAIVRHAPDHCR